MPAVGMAREPELTDQRGREGRRGDQPQPDVLEAELVLEVGEQAEDRAVPHGLRHDGQEEGGVRSLFHSALTLWRCHPRTTPSPGEDLAYGP